MTHTFATLEVSKATFDEITQKLREAKYDHAFVDEYIDMHGIALECEPGIVFKSTPRPDDLMLGQPGSSFVNPRHITGIKTNIPALRGFTFAPAPETVLTLDRAGFLKSVEGLGPVSGPETPDSFTIMQGQVADAMAEKPFSDDVQPETARSKFLNGSMPVNRNDRIVIGTAVAPNGQVLLHTMPKPGIGG